MDELAEIRLRGFALAFDRHAKKQVLSFSAHNLRTAFQRFPARCRRPLVVAQVCDQLSQAMRNSDPRLRIVFVYKTQF